MQNKVKKSLPVVCPSCAGQLDVTELGCARCDTHISGTFPLPALSQLTSAEQEFVLDFVKHSGSLKQMAQQLKLSYPTVRNMLDDIIEKLKDGEKQ